MSSSTQASTAPATSLPEPVSILMPVCNEADIIEEVLEEWVTDVIRHCPPGSEIVLDDCSNDGTEVILRRLTQTHPFIRVNFAPRDGFFNSALRLYKLANCPLVFFTDSDGQYVPAEFWQVAQHIGDHDMVHGAKSDRKDPFYRVGSSLVFNTIIRVLFGSRGRDVNSAFRLIRRPVLTAVAPGIRHLTMLPNAELYLRAEAAHFRIRNISVSHRPRKWGKSRSLPLRSFAAECAKAFRGLLALRAELRDDARPAAPSVAAGSGVGAANRE